MKKTLEVINELKNEGLVKDYAIGGAVAALRWVEPFFTRDLDIFVIPLQERNEKKVISFLPIYDSLKAKGYHQWTGQWIMVEGVPVEFLPAEGLAKEAVEEAVEIEFEGVRTKIVTPEHLIALFLKASREKDKMKIELLLDQTKIDREKLTGILTRHGLDGKFKALYGDRK
jgi:predicted nucleotidyltransferase